MSILVAGGSGAIGLPLVRALAAAGHHVTALTRTTHRHGALESLGASVVAADALDRDALFAAVAAARPTHVIHQLTALPPAGPRGRDDLSTTNRLRIEGTRNLLDAAVGARAKRFLVGSFAILSERSTAGPSDAAARAVRSMESQVLDATRRGLIDGVVLRYGMFYGPEVPSTIAMVDAVRKRRIPVLRHDRGRLPVIHVDDAVNATIRALDAAPPGSVYEIVDDRAVSLTEIVEALASCTGSARPIKVPAWLPRLIAPYMARMTSIDLPLSNQPAKDALGWRLAYPTIREGLGSMFQQAA